MAKNTVDQTAPRIGRSSAVEDERFKRQVRAAQNATYSTVQTLQTDGTGGLTELWVDQDAMAFDSDASIQVKVKGVGVADPATDYAYYEKSAHFVRGSSGAAVQNSTTIDKQAPIESNAAFDCAISLTSDGNLRVRVDDGGVAAMDWKVWVEVRRDT